MKHVLITLKFGPHAEIVIAADAAEDLKLCIEENIFKHFVFKTSSNEIVSFSTFDVFQIKVDDR